MTFIKYPSFWTLVLHALCSPSLPLTCCCCEEESFAAFTCNKMSGSLGFSRRERYEETACALSSASADSSSSPAPSAMSRMRLSANAGSTTSPPSSKTCKEDSS